MRNIKNFVKSIIVLTIILSLSCLNFAPASAAVYEPAKRPRILSFSASSTNVEAGETVILTWNVFNATTIEITGLEKQDEEILPLNGSLEVWPIETTTYTLTATGAGGSTSSSITVDINANKDVSIDLFSASRSEIKLGNTVELFWKTSNAKIISIIGLEKQDEDESLPLSGSLEVFPTATTTYILLVVGQNNKVVYETVTVTVIPDQETVSPLKMEMTLHDWGWEYIIDFIVKNQSNKAVNDWTLTLKKSEFDLIFIWGADYTEKDEFIIISPLYYNGTIKADDYVAFGFQAYGSPLEDFYYKFDYK